MIIEQIQKDITTSRKQRNSSLTTSLTTLYAELSKIGKNDGNRLTNDEECIRGIKKCIVSNEEMIKLHTNQEFIDNLKKETKVFNGYLPQQMSEEELRKEIEDFVAANILEEEKTKGIGKVMGHLKNTFGGSYDGKMASSIVKEVLGL